MPSDGRATSAPDLGVVAVEQGDAHRDVADLHNVVLRQDTISEKYADIMFLRAQVYRRHLSPPPVCMVKLL